MRILFPAFSLFCLILVLAGGIFGPSPAAADSGHAPVPSRADMLPNATGLPDTESPPRAVSVSAQDTALALQIHAINQMEIRIGEMAKTRGSSWSVRAFGDRLMRDHKLSDRRLMSFMGNLDSAANQLYEDKEKTKEAQSKVQSLAQLDKVYFDKDFLEMMEKGHADTIALLTDAQRRLEKDTPMRRWIDKTLPILKQHHLVSQRIQEKQRS